MSDTPQSADWWQAADGKWYPPDQPPAPGWWKASDGNWYPPEPSPAVPSPADVGPAEPAPDLRSMSPSSATVAIPHLALSELTAEALASPPPAAPPPTPPAGPPHAAPPSAPVPPAAVPAGGGSGKGLLIGVGIFVVLLLVAGGVFLVTRPKDGDTATGAGSGPGASSTSGPNGSPSTSDGGGAPPSSEDPSGDDRPSAGADVLPDEDITLADDVVVVRGNEGKAILSAATDGSVIVLDPKADGADKLEDGSVLLLTGVTAVRAVSVEKASDGITITTAPAILTDVIADGSLSWDDMEVDPASARMFITGDEGWEAGPNGDGGAGSSASSGSSSSDDPSGDSGSDTGVTDDGDLVIDPGDLDLGAPAPGAALGELASGLPTVPGLLPRTISGNGGDFGFSITHEGSGSGHHLVLRITPKGDVSGTIEADVTINSLANSGNLEVKDQQLNNFDFTMSDLGGEALISTNLQGLENVASFVTPAFFRLPFSLDFPAIVGGIPFTLSLSGTIQVNLAFSLANSTLSGSAEITFGGDAGFHFAGTSLSLDGKRTQDAPDILETIKGAAPGPVGIVFTTELPKIGFGFKFLQTGAGIYISNGMVASQNILPPPVICTAANIAYVLAGGVEASFLGKDFDIARKAFVDKRWNWAAPNDERCSGATPPG